MRHRPGRPGRVGDATPCLQALQPEAGFDIFQQRGFAAEKMRAAGDVEQQAILPVEGDERRIAVAPCGGGRQQRGVGLRVMFVAFQRWHQRPRIAQRLAVKETVPRAVGFMGDDADRILLPCRDDNGRRVRTPVRKP